MEGSLGQEPRKLKGLLLAGGKGTRLRPFTYTGAKQLVALANRPILFHAIDQLTTCGITDLGIVVGETKDEVMAAVGDGSQFGAKITFIEQSAPLGIAHAVKIAEDLIGTDPFVLFLGDNILKEGIGRYVEQFQTGCHNGLVLLYPVDEPQNFGVAELDGDTLIRVVEKPQDPPSNIAVTCMHCFDLSVLVPIRTVQPSARRARALQGDTITAGRLRGHRMGNAASCRAIAKTTGSSIGAIPNYGRSMLQMVRCSS